MPWGFVKITFSNEGDFFRLAIATTAVFYFLGGY
jgi:hypothetical protein